MSSRQSPQLRAVSAQSSRHHHALAQLTLLTDAQHSDVLIWSSKHWVQIMVKVNQTLVWKGQIGQSCLGKQNYILTFIMTAGWHPGDGAGVPPEAGCAGEGRGGGEAVLLQRQRHHQPPPHPTLLLPRRPAWVPLLDDIIPLLTSMLHQFTQYSNHLPGPFPCWKCLLAFFIRRIY